MLGNLLEKCIYSVSFAHCTSCISYNDLSFILGKIGYGTFSEALAYKLPFVFVRRDYFNEEPFLRNMLEVRTSFFVNLFLLDILSI